MDNGQTVYKQATLTHKPAAISPENQPISNSTRSGS